MTDMKDGNSVSVDIHALHKEWDETACPICMDHPHNAVLIICSSHEKGCRSYTCDTSYRHSNCLDRFKKSKTNHKDGVSISESSESDRLGQREPHVLTSEPNSLENHETRNFEETTEENNSQERDRFVEVQVGANNLGGFSVQSTEELDFLKCPLCRGDVLGWKIVQEARQYLDLKSRSCSRESCSFSGNYRELRGHARRVHPTTRPGDVDLLRQRSWRRLEHQQESGDVLSAIRSAMPGAVVLGDYVIDNGGDRLSREHDDTGSGEGSGSWLTTFFLFHMLRSPIRSTSESRGTRRTHRRSSAHRNLWGENLLGLQDEDNDASLDDDNPAPRRRRRIMRPRANEEQP